MEGPLHSSEFCVRPSGKFNFGLGPAALAGPGAPRGNLFGEAALPMWSEEGGGGAIGKGKSGDKELCELCGGMFPHPVTYHMRGAHPGILNHNSLR